MLGNFKRGPKDNSRRKGIPAQRKELRRLNALELKKKHDALTPEQKLAKLDAGGHRALRERARLTKLIKESVKT